MTTAETAQIETLDILEGRRLKPTRQARRSRRDAYRLIHGTGAGCEVSPAQSSITSRLTHLKSRTSQMGQERRFDSRSITSDLPRSTDILGGSRHAQR
jgi:hypothetical protein